MLVPEVAAKLGTSQQWVRRLIKNDQLVAVRLGTQWLVSEPSIARYMENKAKEQQK